jgi:putative intracellular protease/amidase
MRLSFASLWRRLYVVYRPRRPYEHALVEIAFLSCARTRPRSTRGMMLVADASVEELPSPDLIVVPGGPVAMEALEAAAAVEWLGRAHETSRWTTTVHAPARSCSAPPASLTASRQHGIGSCAPCCEIRRGVTDRVVVEGKGLTPPLIGL